MTAALKLLFLIPWLMWRATVYVFRDTNLFMKAAYVALVLFVFFILVG